MEAPTVKQVRTWSKIDFDQLGFAEASSEEEEDGLQFIVDRAVDYVLNVTGHTLEDVPAELVTTAQEAVQRRSEQLAYKEQEDEAETASDIDMIQNFSAGSYSENRKNMERATKFVPNVVNAWPHLNDLLMRLMTEEKLEWWRERWGQNQPAFAIAETWWEGADIIPESPMDEFMFGA